MAAPNKQGLEYFPIDVNLDNDDKLAMIIGEFQSKGELLYIKLLSWTYQHNGYYTEWNEDVQLRFLRRYNYCGFSMSFINEVVPRLIKWGLFDATVFDSFHILTSERIQKTWFDASRKRKERKIIPDFWILEVNDAAKAELTPRKAELIDKVKESKVKESKGKEINDGDKSPTQKKSVKSIDERKKDFYDLLIPHLTTYGKDMIREFYDYWTETKLNGTKMRFEKESTFEIAKRLKRWHDNNFKNSKFPNAPAANTPMVYVPVKPKESFFDQMVIDISERSVYGYEYYSFIFKPNDALAPTDKEKEIREWAQSFKSYTELVNAIKEKIGIKKTSAA